MGAKHLTVRQVRDLPEASRRRLRSDEDDLEDFMRRQIIRVHHTADQSIARVERVRRKETAASGELVLERDLALDLIEVRVRR